VSTTQIETVAFTVNGESKSLNVDSKQTLLDVLRNSLGLKATRMGCAAGQCGACKVIVDGYAVNACQTPMWAVQGKVVKTLEGLGTVERPHPLQTAFIQQQAAQCGFCTSGLIMAAAALLERNPSPDETTIKQALDDQLCRCGIQQRAIRAVLQACK